MELSMDMGDWRYNVRASNTEPLLRLSVRTHANAQLVAQPVSTVETLIKEII